jgi:DHA1 family bicyclomycin/chloramphenicol resistance-like MFS transporter
VGASDLGGPPEGDRTTPGASPLSEQGGPEAIDGVGALRNELSAPRGMDEHLARSEAPREGCPNDATGGIPPRPRGLGQRLTLPVALVLGGLSAFGPLSTDMYLPALPRVAADFQASQWAVQATVSACLVGLGLGQLVAGPVSDRLGRRRPLLLGVGLFALASWAAALAPSLGFLLGVRLVQGLAGAAGIAIARAVVRDLFDGPEVARVLSLLMLVTGLAPIGAPILGGQILKVATWQEIFSVLGTVGVVILLGVAVWLPESLPPERRRSGGIREAGRTFRAISSSRSFVGYALPAALAFSVLFSYISASPFVLQRQFHLSAQGFSFVFAVNSFVLVALSQLNARLAARVPLQRLLTLGLCLCVLATGALLVAALADLGLAIFLAALAVAVGSLGLITPNAVALALQPYPRSAGAASAQLGALQFAVGALVGPTTGLRLGTPAVSMAVVVVASAVAALASFSLLARSARPPAT